MRSRWPRTTIQSRKLAATSAHGRSCFRRHNRHGASIKQLLAMARRNIELALGAGARGARTHVTWTRLQLRVHRVRTDNRLDRGEWLRLRDGRLIKTDALDHHQGHDLIGCQDPAWDVAGAVVEFGLDDDQTDRTHRGNGPVPRSSRYSTSTSFPIVHSVPGRRRLPQKWAKRRPPGAALRTATRTTSPFFFNVPAAGLWQESLVD